MVGLSSLVFVPASPQAQPPVGPVLGRDPEAEEVRFPRPLTFDYAQATALEELGILYKLQRESAGSLRVVTDTAGLEAALADGAIAAVVHFEGAEQIDPRLDRLESFYALGLRSLGIVWSRPNDFGEGVPYLFDRTPDTGPGLTDPGKALVKECNALGIMIDVSHLNEKGFWDVARLTSSPLVATHSNAHALCPSTRNLTDKQSTLLQSRVDW